MAAKFSLLMIDNLVNRVFLPNFAASLFVSRNHGRQHDNIEILAKSGKFNVLRLDRPRITEIMNMRVDRPKKSAEEMDKWLKAFCSNWNKGESSGSSPEEPAITPDFYRQPLFKATCNNVGTYHTYEEMERLPSIVDPESVAHKELCCGIPDLYTFEADSMPSNILLLELSLDCTKSFNRFLKSLHTLVHDEKELTNYVRLNVTNPASIKVS
ncbi:hypothetical protein EYC80_001512 [Monilinia laxa]|uniref:Uncharacterized protein n=1 Tax=Monilinia laxa TaxID=61186 RepID=A0A5N6K528_MONLA|nr:hypothetical protein EYC80_001512 [Monilinia laxa]